jgi:glycosyltransferase involved in cell wall biosynthesis
MNRNLPFFSVIIPTYNRAHLIVTTIKSVLAQSYTNYEIIIVDNASTDNTLEIVQPYLAQANISLIAQPVNMERAVSRNAGFDAAKGDYVTLLDSDDVLYPNCLQDAYDYHTQNTSVLFYHCNFEYINEAGKITRKGATHSITNAFKTLAQGNYISNIGVFIKTEIAKTVRVDETPILIGTEDYDFVMRLLYKCKQIGYINKTNCAVLEHPQRTVLTHDFDLIEQRITYFVHKQINSNLFEGEYAPYKQDFIVNNYLYICGAAAIRKRTAKAFSYLFKAFATNPFVLFKLKFTHHFLVIIKYSIK